MDRDQGRGHDAVAPTPPKRPRRASPERDCHNAAANGDSQQLGYGPQQQNQQQRPQSPEHRPQPQQQSQVESPDERSHENEHQPPEHSVHLHHQQEQRQTEALVNLQDNKEESDDAAGPNIANLPDLTLLEVFSWLPWEEVYGKVRRVCRYWRDLLRGRCPCAGLTFWGGDAFERAVSGERAGALLRSARHLKCLEVLEREDAFELLREVPRHNTELCRLEVSGCEGDRNRANLSRSLAALFDTCSGISVLFLVDIQCESNDHLTNIGARLPELRMMSLIRISWEGPAVLGEVLNSCARLVSLRAYSIKGAALSDQDVARLSETLRGTLRVLKIDGDELTDEGFSALATLPRLRNLGVLNAPGLTDAGMSGLAPLRSMDALRLTRASRVTAAGWRQLFRPVARSWELRKLSLKGCALVDDWVLYSVGGACPGLVSVDLTGCKRVTAKGKARLLRGCLSLKTKHLVMHAK